MGTFTYSDLIALDLGRLHAAVSDWETMVGNLDRLQADARDGLLKKSEGARWQGVNATVTKDFVRGAAKEFADLHREAQSIHHVLADAHAELSQIQKRAKALTEEARKGSPDRSPDPDHGLLVTDGGNGTVKVIEAVCDVNGTSQRTRDRMQWYADTLTGLVAHAAEIDAAVTRALRKSHGGDPHNAGHATYTSLDEDQLPRAMKLASLGEDANAGQRAELRRLWQSLSPEARAELWKARKDDLLAAGLLSPTVKQIAPDRGSGRHGAEEPTFTEFMTKDKMRMLASGSDWQGMNDASRHMQHYLENSGEPLDLPVDKMLHDDEGLRIHAEEAIRGKQDGWREQALEEFRRNGGRPVTIPVETGNSDYSFPQGTQDNWFYAVGSTRTNVTGVVTVVPGADGEPKVGLDYQVNAWDRYNWDEGKGVTIGPLSIPDGQPARLHTTGLAQEFDMQGSSSVKHYDLGSATPNNDPLPAPDDPGREGTRQDPGRERTKR
ncbi:hypothetical protein OG250_05655 [Streptomyces sp. NBC_00487]|uniref:hypothetical protein n=1 Tax=unclassified Streptomyces TaxID=2593676 RepID=UPI002E1821D7|nr:MULTISPECIES: hypothetical protein [unclassified Streptomyces]